MSTLFTLQIGQTPLIYAVLEEQVAVVELLVAAGADVNKGNPLHSNWAPIHWAALTDNTQVQGGEYLEDLRIFDAFENT